jgi:hypothetical protein
MPRCFRSLSYPRCGLPIATVVSKEVLYRYLIRVAERLRSQLMIANACIPGPMPLRRWLSWLASAARCSAGHFSTCWPPPDGLHDLAHGRELAWGAMKELIDTGLDEAQVELIRQTLLETPGVLGLHELRTRRMAHQALVDAHVQVDARISVSEGHRIAESARARVLREHPEVLDVLVHIDPEDDLDPDAAAARLPGRDAVLLELKPLLAELPPPEKVICII